ncbi:MAG TPA: c-type cytochrome [Rhizomicrobium sp.]|nr:c-type cytochrome [Rhizomicrobium sp.]
MRKFGIIVVLSGFSVAALALGGAALAAGEGVPIWAYPVPQVMSPPSKPDNTIQKKVPGSKAHFTEAGVNDRFNVPDWFPKDHPPLPAVVAHGHSPKVAACGYCHLPNGQGRPENASLAGQPADYIIEQVTEMKEGRRKTSQPTMGSIKGMYAIAAAVSPEELKTAAEYFSKLKYKKWIRVVESDTVPKFDISSHNMLVKSKSGGTEPLGKRIIEIPENLDLVELRDPNSGFVAYVPKGAIARGRKLVQSGNGAFPCSSCHGASLKGDGNVPSLAGRSPSEIVRQLYDIQHGTRGGPAVDPMKPEVASMTDENRIDIAAYLASLKP